MPLLREDGLFIRQWPLPPDAQGFTGVLQLEQLGPDVTAVGLVKGHHELAVEGFEYHAVTSVGGDEGFVYLLPGARNFPRHRTREAYRVLQLAEARPDHQQAAGARAIQKRSVRDVAVLLASDVTQTPDPLCIGCLEQRPPGLSHHSRAADTDYH